MLFDLRIEDSHERTSAHDSNQVSQSVKSVNVDVCTAVGEVGSHDDVGARTDELTPSECERGLLVRLPYPSETVIHLVHSQLSILEPFQAPF